MQLTVSQSGDAVSGTLQVFRDNAVSGTVTGHLSDIRSLSVTGTLQAPNGQEGAEQDVVSSWATVVDESLRAQSGQFNLERHFTNAFGPQVLLVSCQIITLTRQ